MNPSILRDGPAVTPHPETASGVAEGRPSASIVPFAAARANGRRFRRADDRSEARGRILLFTGVRYERLDEPTATPDALLPQRRRS